jgi:hypothetical protein
VTKLRTAELPGQLVLFVAGEPQTSPDIRQTTAGMGERIAGLMIPGAGAAFKDLRFGHPENRPRTNDLEQPPSSGQPHWHLPPSQVACLDMVMDAAERKRIGVLVVDVDRPGMFQDLVERYVRPNDVLPLLVRSDGARLGGEESFTAARVRKFIATR